MLCRFKHYSGQAKQHLSETLLNLNLLVFVYQTVLDILNKRYRPIR